MITLLLLGGMASASEYRQVLQILRIIMAKPYFSSKYLKSCKSSRHLGSVEKVLEMITCCGFSSYNLNEHECLRRSKVCLNDIVSDIINEETINFE